MCVFQCLKFNLSKKEMVVEMCYASVCIIHAFNNTVRMMFLKSNAFLKQLTLEKIVLCLMACLSFVSYQLEALLVSMGCLPDVL